MSPPPHILPLVFVDVFSLTSCWKKEERKKKIYGRLGGGVKEKVREDEDDVPGCWRDPGAAKHRIDDLARSVASTGGGEASSGTKTCAVPRGGEGSLQKDMHCGPPLP